MERALRGRRRRDSRWRSPASWSARDVPLRSADGDRCAGRTASGPKRGGRDVERDRCRIRGRQPSRGGGGLALNGTFCDVLGLRHGRIATASRYRRPSDDDHAVRTEGPSAQARVVSAADASRHAFQRDLHTGAQQRLVHGIRTLRLARETLPADAATADSMIGEALESVDRAARTAARRASDDAAGVGPRWSRRRGTGTVPSARGGGVGRHSIRSASGGARTLRLLHALRRGHRRGRVRGRTPAEIEVLDAGDALTLVVSDDGHAAADARAARLAPLADRVAAVGGAMSIVEATDGGAAVRVTLSGAALDPEAFRQR